MDVIHGPGVWGQEFSYFTGSAAGVYFRLPHYVFVNELNVYMQLLKEM